MKSNQNKGSKGKSEHKKKQSTKGDQKGKGHNDMSNIKCFNCGEYDIMHMTVRNHTK